jgi:hypothetical protein
MSTAAAIEATRQGAIFEATARASATAYQVTVVANATATEQFQLDSVAAIGNATRDAIEADRLRAEATATAVRLDWLVAYDERTAVRQERASLWWHWFRVVMLVLIAYGGYRLILWIIPSLYERLSPGVKDENGRTIAVKKGYQQQQVQPEPVAIDEYQEPPEDAPVYETLVSLPSGGTFTAKSPTPGDFINWLGAVLDNPRAEFSNNQRKARGWKETYYWGLITDMKRVGWLSHKPDSRGCYTMTDAGKQQARVWLAER